MTKPEERDSSLDCGEQKNAKICSILLFMGEHSIFEAFHWNDQLEQVFLNNHPTLSSLSLPAKGYFKIENHASAFPHINRETRWSAFAFSKMAAIFRLIFGSWKL